MRKRDRIAQARYELTGDFAIGVPAVGSSTLFSVPDGMPPRHEGETVLSALTLLDVLAESETHLERAERVLTERVHALLAVARRGEIDIG
jgi:hypothetical protein